MSVFFNKTAHCFLYLRSKKLSLHLNFKKLLIMPKIKTVSGAKKRFKVTGSGKIKHVSANHRHLMRKKSNKAKGRTEGTSIVAVVDTPRVKTMLGLNSNH